MPKRREKVDVSLFPFLSVLCTVIAVMVMMGIMILNTRVVARAEQAYRRIQDSVAQRRPGTLDARSDGIDSRQLRKLEEEVAKLNETLRERKTRLAGVTQKFKALQDLLESKKTLMEVEHVRGTGREMAAPDPIAMIPEDGVKVHLKPILVEVKEDRYVIHPSKQVFPAMKLPAGSDLPKPSAELREFLQEVDKQRQQQYLVFLIHPNGSDAFFGIQVYLKLNHNKLRIGWEPFARNWVQTDSAEE